MLKSLYNHFASHPEGVWVMQPQNVPILYDFVKTHKIKKVLDLGTGIGTTAAIVALALKDKGEMDYHIDTVESLDKCINLARKLIPVDLQEHTTFHKSEVKIWQTDKIPYQYFSIYNTVPEGDYDLIINDGPPPMLVGDDWIDLPNGTITEMLLREKIKSGAFVAWDGRTAMLKILERYFGDNFYLARPVQRGDSLSILERKDNPVAFKDFTLEVMKQSSYFKNIDEKTITASNGTPSLGETTASNSGA